jgi:hypothetical protein
MSSCNILISGKIIKEMPGSVASGTSCIVQYVKSSHCSYNEISLLSIKSYYIIIFYYLQYSLTTCFGPRKELSLGETIQKCIQRRALLRKKGALSFLDSVFLFIYFCIVSTEVVYFGGPKHVVSEFCS